MKNIFYLIIGVILFSNCKKDYYLTIEDVEFYPILLNNPRSIETEFLDSAIQFAATFKMNPAGVNFGVRVDEIYMNNDIIPDDFIIMCNKDLYFIDDTARKYTNLISYFSQQVYRDNFHISYSFMNNQAINNIGYYHFIFETTLTDNTTISDSCIVKITF